MSKERYLAIAAVTIIAVGGFWHLFGRNERVAVHSVHQEQRKIEARANMLEGMSGDRTAHVVDRVDDLQAPRSAFRNSSGGINLRFEQRVLRSGRISYDQATYILKGDNFDRYMGEVLAQSESDMEAAHLTEIYTQALGDALKKDSSISIEKFGCGLSVCVGSIITQGIEGEEQYTHFHQALSPAEGTPAYSMIEVAKGDEDTGIEYRFVFATDPLMNGIGDATRPR